MDLADLAETRDASPRGGQPVGKRAAGLRACRQYARGGRARGRACACTGLARGEDLTKGRNFHLRAASAPVGSLAPVQEERPLVVHPAHNSLRVLRGLAPEQVNVQFAVRDQAAARAVARSAEHERRLERARVADDEHDAQRQADPRDVVLVASQEARVQQVGLAVFCVVQLVQVPGGRERDSDRISVSNGSQ